MTIRCTAHSIILFIWIKIRLHTILSFVHMNTRLLRKGRTMNDKLHAKDTLYRLYYNNIVHILHPLLSILLNACYMHSYKFDSLHSTSLLFFVLYFLLCLSVSLPLTLFVCFVYKGFTYRPFSVSGSFLPSFYLLLHTFKSCL